MRVALTFARIPLLQMVWDNVRAVADDKSGASMHVQRIKLDVKWDR